ncbi:MAG: TIGR02449 family protein [Candidatus Sedimenticola endophacoides]
MNNEDQTALLEQNLKRLEVRVDDLIHIVALLKEENKSLRVKQGNLVSERAELIEKTELAKSRVEAMISRLKSMEANP